MFFKICIVFKLKLYIKKKIDLKLGLYYIIK